MKECRGKSKEENKDKSIAAVDHLPVVTGQVDGDPRVRVGGAVGHGHVAISVPLMVLGGDEDLEIPGRVHDGDGERRPNPEAGVKLLPALVVEGGFALLLDLE